MKIQFFLILSLLSAQIYAQKYKDFKKSKLIFGNDTLPYRIMYPDSMIEGEKYPLILYLHGAGSRGTENERQLIHGSKFLRNKNIRQKYPAIVLFPQCPKGVMWTNRKKKKVNGKWEFSFPLGNKPTLPATLANLLVDSFMHKNYVDTSKVYVMGMSMGGIGTLEFLYRWSNKFAAAVVVCGGNDYKLCGKYCDIPIWFFHGGKDRVVPQIYSKSVYDKLHKCNKNTKYTLYPQIGHNSWDSAFSNTKLLKWMFQHSKTKP